jgi:vacuolar-type H+-ATPase subunit H
MQKLEEILRAEDRARHAVAEAREKATAVIVEAQGEAAALLAQERARTAAEAAAIEAEALDAAHRSAQAIRDSSAVQLEGQLARARELTGDVVERVVTELAG